jgi:hypothetical protein
MAAMQEERLRSLTIAEQGQLRAIVKASSAVAQFIRSRRSLLAIAGEQHGLRLVPRHYRCVCGLAPAGAGIACPGGRGRPRSQRGLVGVLKGCVNARRVSIFFLGHMDRIDIPRGTGEALRRANRVRKRPAELDPEQVISNAPPEPGAEPSLASYIPSALITTDQRARALVIGTAPAWSRRLRRIDTLTEQALERLEAAWRSLAADYRQRPDRFAAAWRAQAASFDLSLINDLISRHNEHFPAEANLPMDPRTGDFIGPGGGDYRRPRLDVAWILERFPPELEKTVGGQ